VTFSRIAAAAAAVLTVLLLQATLVAPVTSPLPVSLPAVLVAAVALCSGPGTGMSLGFTAGLIADLGSAHPAGVLALAWLGLGLGCGLLGDPDRRLVKQVLIAGTSCAVVASVVTVLLAVLDSTGTSVGGAAATALGQLPLTALGDAVLAGAVVAVVGVFLRSAALRPARPPAPRGAVPRG
jgi:cell shape-determining protein MreD